MKKLFVAILFSSFVYANSAPVVSNVHASQRTDSSGIVDITYQLYDADGDKCTVTVLISANGGVSYTITPSELSGDVGADIASGSCSIQWASKGDLPGVYGVNYRVRVIAEDLYASNSLNMTWVYVDDPGIEGHEGFTGLISKYETTNAQYCKFLNDALASHIIVVGKYGVVYSNSGSDSGLRYFDTVAATPRSQIIYSDGVFSVRSRDGYDMSNHPVVMVSWFGATAFCEYYGYRLPTEWEWQAVADYDGSYIYGCGLDINPTLANYGGSNPFSLSDYPYTNPVGYFGQFGHGLCDMAGNVHEWTSSPYSSTSTYRILRGGCWFNSDFLCVVSQRHSFDPASSNDGDAVGFRVVCP